MQRTLQMVRHLPDLGIDVEVLAPTDPKWLAEDPALLAALLAEPCACTARASAVRARACCPASGWRRPRGAVERGAARLAIVGRQLLLPDVESVWLSDAVPAARRLLATGRFDAIVTTSPPASVAVAGVAARPLVRPAVDRRLARRVAGLGGAAARVGARPGAAGGAAAARGAHAAARCRRRRA